MWRNLTDEGHEASPATSRVTKVEEGRVHVTEVNEDMTDKKAPRTGVRPFNDADCVPRNPGADGKRGAGEAIPVLTGCQKPVS